MNSRECFSPGRFRRGRSGFTLLEILISLLCSAFVGAMILSFIQINMISNNLAMGLHAADLEARRPLDNLVDCIRYAQPYGTGQAAIAAGTASSITIYDDMSGTTSRYWLDTSTSTYLLKRTRTASTLQLSTGIQSLMFTYYLASGLTPAQGSCWTATANPNAPTAAEMPNIVAVGVKMSILVDGTLRYFTTPVRLRNGSRAISGK